MTQTTRVPEVVAALVAVAEALRVAGTVGLVIDGPQPRAAAAKGTTGLAVAVTDRAVESRLAKMAGLDVGRYEETVETVCGAWSWSGGTDLAPHRAKCAEIHAAFMDALRADVHLGGICEQVVMGTRSLWTPQSDSQGASYFLAFSVVTLSYL
jgi:hypothetical protein